MFETITRKRTPLVPMSPFSGPGSPLLMMMLISGSALAAETNLGRVGNTQLQQDTGDSVQLTCGGFVRNRDASTAEQRALFSTCGAMVQNGREVTGAPGGTSRSLGLDQNELAGALQQVATEEFASSESMANEMSGHRVNTFIARLGELRGGARGVSLAGLATGNGNSVAGLTNYRDGAVRGGAAGDDGDAAWGRWGLFASGNYGFGKRDETDRTDKYDYDSYNLTVGADYRVNDNFVAGVAINYYDVDSDFKRTSTVAGGGINVKGWGGAAYGSYHQDAWYLDGIAGYGRSDYDVKRRVSIASFNPAVAAIDETAKGSPDSNDYTFSFGGGYSFDRGALSYGPFARLNYLRVDIDGYRENGAEGSGLNLSVDGQDWKSFTSVLGGEISYALNHSFGVVIPQGRLGWVHEFKNDSEELTATYSADPRQNVLRALTDDPDRNYFELALGVSTVFRNGFQAFLNYDTVLGFDDVKSHLFTLGGRMEF